MSSTTVQPNTSASTPPPQSKRSRVDSSPATNTAAVAPAALGPSSTSAATMTIPLLVKKLSSRARLPTRGSAFAAGYDLYAAQENSVPARGKALVATNLALAVPPGTYGRIAPRSGLASKHMIDTGAGVIDADYRGEIKILLFNHGEVDFAIKEGDRVAQLVLEKISTPEVKEVDALEESVRGSDGFGSTG